MPVRQQLVAVNQGRVVFRCGGEQVDNRRGYLNTLVSVVETQEVIIFSEGDLLAINGDLNVISYVRQPICTRQERLKSGVLGAIWQRVFVDVRGNVVSPVCRQVVTVKCVGQLLTLSNRVITGCVVGVPIDLTKLLHP